MTDENNKTIEYLIYLSRKIYEKIYKLYTLEIEGKKNTQEFQNTIISLKLTLDIETQNLKSLKTDQIVTYSKLLKKRLKGHLSDYEILQSASASLLSVKHIYNKLEELKRDNLIQTYQNTTIEKRENNPFDYSSYLEKNIHDDIERLFIFFMKTFANNKNIQNDLNFQNSISKIKYQTIYLNPDILDILNQNDKIFLTFKASANLLNIDTNHYQKLIKEYFFFNINNQLDMLLNIDDTNYQNKAHYLNLLILYSAIASYLEISPNKNFLIRKIRAIMKESITNNLISVANLSKLLKKSHSYKNISILELKGIDNENSKRF